MQRPVVNIYSLADAELERLHRLMFEVEKFAQVGPYGNPTYGHNYPLDPRVIFDRIMRINDAILEGIRITDAKVQEKVAELALTDVQKESK